MRLLRCASGAANTGQWLRDSARTFDMIVLTKWECCPASFPVPHSAGSLCVQCHAAAESHLHTDYEQELVPLFVKVQMRLLSESELEQDAVKRYKVVSIQLIPQLLEQRGLFRGKCFAIKVVSVYGFDSAVATPYCLNGLVKYS